MDTTTPAPLLVPTPEPTPYEGFVRRLLFAACADALRTGCGAPVVNGQPLTYAHMRRLVAYARRHGFL